mgnify:CR=1 FL=1
MGGFKPFLRCGFVGGGRRREVVASEREDRFVRSQEKALPLTVHLFHVGDTRIYRLRQGELKCLTRDHQTWASREKAFLSRAMGADHSVDIDYRSLPVEVGGSSPLVNPVPVRPLPKRVRR